MLECGNLRIKMGQPIDIWGQQEACSDKNKVSKDLEGRRRSRYM